MKSHLKSQANIETYVVSRQTIKYMLNIAYMEILNSSLNLLLTVQSYVSCSIGVGFIGYNMVTYGIANALGSLLVSSCVARQVVAREALVGVASVLQLGLLVFLLVWVPDPNLVVVFFALSALWGMCDALWQTQCTCELYSMSAIYDIPLYDDYFIGIAVS